MTDQEILKKFEEHCLAGNSVSSFSGKLYQKQWEYARRIKTCEKFREIAKKYRKKSGPKSLLSVEV